VDYIDVSPKQVVSVAAALIPFLENDDANRALMGSNMQRQAVPLVQAEAPLVGTGMEAVVARDSGAAVAARRRAWSSRWMQRIVSARRASRRGESGVDIYRLSKFQRSNQNTCINQRPIVKVGDVVEPATSSPTVRRPIWASWRSAATCSSRSCPGTATTSRTPSSSPSASCVTTCSPRSTSKSSSVMARDTKLGPEEITRDIPNVGEEALRNLDEAGIVAIGAEVKRAIFWSAR
jgi:DNA-directed RNA polymerase subunit beta